MKGLVLAGGFATRLRPLSCSKPKLLFPIVGVPLIDYLVRWLEGGKIEETILAVNHLSEKLRTEVDSMGLNNKVSLSVEETPLGTGGPLSLAAPILEDSDPIVVVNGDVVSDIRLSDLLTAHLESGAEATIALVRVEDTRPFGLVTLGSNDGIVGFDEKSTDRQGAGWINAGVYVLNKSVVRTIPRGRPVSLEREIFPVLARRNGLKGWRHQGFWYDIGTIPDYIRANMELLKEFESSLSRVERQAVVVEGVRNPSHVGAGSSVSRGASVGPRAILSRNVRVASGGVVRDSIVFEDSVLGENCHVDGSLVGEATSIGRNTVIGQGCLVAGEVNIPDGVSLRPGSVVLN